MLRSLLVALYCMVAPRARKGGSALLAEGYEFVGGAPNPIHRRNR